jgi:hypothetical protein
MTAAEEVHLYLTDYPAWCRFIAPRWRDMLLAAKTKDEKEALWNAATDTLKSEIRALRDEWRRAA